MGRKIEGVPLFLICFAFFTAIIFIIGYASASTITLGVEPSEVNLFMGTDTHYDVQFKFFNPSGDTDAIYLLEPEPALLPNLHIACDLGSDYWCNQSFVVPKGTTRTGDNIKLKVRLEMHEKKIFNTSLYVYGRPVGVNETVNGTGASIKTRIGINIKFNPPTTTTTTTSSTTTTLPTTTTTSSNSPSVTTTTNSWWSIFNPPTTTTTRNDVKNENGTLVIIPSPKTTTTIQTTTTIADKKESTGNFPIGWIIIIGSVASIAITFIYFKWFY